MWQQVQQQQEGAEQGQQQEGEASAQAAAAAEFGCAQVRWWCLVGWSPRQQVAVTKAALRV